MAYGKRAYNADDDKIIFNAGEVEVFSSPKREVKIEVLVASWKGGESKVAILRTEKWINNEGEWQESKNANPGRLTVDSANKYARLVLKACDFIKNGAADDEEGEEEPDDVVTTPKKKKSPALAIAQKAIAKKGGKK